MESDDGNLDGFSAITQTRIFWNSRKRSANGQYIHKTSKDTHNSSPNKQEEEEEVAIDVESQTIMEGQEDPATAFALSERRKALFEPLEPTNARRASEEIVVPPPDFDAACYPRGWLIGKKRKLVNVDVVESMRRIAVQEMNRKDREINGLNEQLEEDARVVEHLQLQLMQERSKRADVERENSVLQNQVTMLMDMLQDAEGADVEDGHRQES